MEKLERGNPADKGCFGVQVLRSVSGYHPFHAQTHPADISKIAFDSLNQT